MLTITLEAAQPAGEAETATAQTETKTPVAAADATPAAPAKAEAEVAQVEGEAADAPAAQDAAKPSFALNLAASDVDREMEKRKARAARFNVGGQANADTEATETAAADTEALKNLERAKRFGTGQTAIGRLDEALPMERERGKKRGPVPENAVADDPALKKNFGRRKGFGKRNRDNPAKPTGVSKPGSGAFTNDKDRQAAEARKKRFAQS